MLGLVKFPTKKHLSNTRTVFFFHLLLNNSLTPGLLVMLRLGVFFRCFFRYTIILMGFLKVLINKKYDPGLSAEI